MAKTNIPPSAYNFLRLVEPYSPLINIRSFLLGISHTMTVGSKLVEWFCTVENKKLTGGMEWCLEARTIYGSNGTKPRVAMR